ncbi:MAG: NAD-dependent epimerase/dehydratase family protein [Candidatus Methanomethylicia archaeon]
MRILVTGGAGFIGSHIVGRLLKDGFEVSVLDNFCSGLLENISSYFDMGLKLFEGDVSSMKVFDELSKYSFDVIIHLAALISVDESCKFPLKYHHVNVDGTLNVLEFARRVGVDKFIFASSAAVYGDPIHLPINELHPLNPRSIYAASKVEGEFFVKVYSKLYGFKSTSLRIFNVYGPRQRLNDYSGVIRIFLDNAFNGKPLTIYGDGMQVRDFIYVDDVVDVIMKFIYAEDFVFDVYNVGTGKPTRIIDLAKLIIDLTGSSSGIVYAPARSGDIRFSYADISRLRDEFNFNCRFDLREGLIRTINYFSNNICYG